MKYYAVYGRVRLAQTGFIFYGIYVLVLQPNNFNTVKIETGVSIEHDHRFVKRYSK